MKQLLISFLLSLTFLLPSTPSTPLVSKVQASIVHLEFLPRQVCTGFVVSASRGEALTAAHCLPEEGEQLYVDGEPSEVLKRSDLFGLVSIAKMGKPPLTIKGTEVGVGEEVLTFGFGWGKPAVFTRHVAGFEEGDILMDGPLAPGMSGGPVVNAKGEVVGVNQASNQIVGVACGAKEIREFLSK